MIDAVQPDLVTVRDDPREECGVTAHPGQQHEEGRGGACCGERIEHSVGAAGLRPSDFKALGRSQATVNAAIAPELEPPIPCISGSFEMLYSL